MFPLAAGDRRVRKLAGAAGAIWWPRCFLSPARARGAAFELGGEATYPPMCMSFSPSSSSLSKGESVAGYRAHLRRDGGRRVGGSPSLHGSVPQPSWPLSWTKLGERTVVLNGGDGLSTATPARACWISYTLAHVISMPSSPQPRGLSTGKRIGIVGDVLHSRVARSNLWALSGCGADVVLCGPPRSLVAGGCLRRRSVEAPPPGQTG